MSDEPKVELLELNELLPNELLPDELLPNELLPNELPLEVVLAADPPDGPIPASVDALPDSGWPKNPIAVGARPRPPPSGPRRGFAIRPRMELTFVAGTVWPFGHLAVDETEHFGGS